MAAHPRFRFLSGLCLLCSTFLLPVAGSAATAALPATAVSPLATPAMTAGQVQVLAQGAYTTADGRVFSVADLGAVGALTDQVQVGGLLRTVAGHGRNAANRYDAHGWEGWVDWRVAPTVGTRTSFILSVRRTREDGHLEVPGVPLVADPFYQATTFRLAAQRPAGPTTWLAHAGQTQVSLFGLPQATVYAGGLTIRTPVTPTTHASAGLTVASDDFGGGRHLTLQAEAQLTLGTPAHGALLLGASYFPQGVPIAGTPLSPASLVGAFYGGDTATNFRERAVGYLSLAGTKSW